MTAIAPWLAQLLEDEIDESIRTDSRTTNATFLGWPRERIFWDVIGGGQADFDAPLGQLTGIDRALLYTKYNQRRHLDELSHAFNLLLADGKVRYPTILDLGCGPFTAGLALANIIGSTEPFRYFGIDRALSMQMLGRRLADGARAGGALHSTTSYLFCNDLDSVDFGATRGEVTMVVASYLLASPSLNIDVLVKSINSALKRIGPGPAALLYTNSASGSATSKYFPFRDAMKNAGFDVVTEDTEIFHDTVKTPSAVHYALLFRPAVTTIEVLNK